MDGFSLPQVDPVKAFATLVLAGAVAAVLIHLYDVKLAPSIRGLEAKAFSTKTVDQSGG